MQVFSSVWGFKAESAKQNELDPVLHYKVLNCPSALQGAGRSICSNFIHPAASESFVHVQRDAEEEVNARGAHCALPINCRPVITRN